MEFGDGDVEGDGVDIWRADDDAHVGAVALPFFVGAIDVPAAGHEHVGEENEVAGEMDEQPFAVGFDFFDGAAGDGRVDFDAFEFGEDGFEGGDGLVGERAVERAGGAEDCVAFRHLCGLGEVVVGLAVVALCSMAASSCDGIIGGDAAHLVAEGAGGEAGFFEEAGEEMFAGGSSPLISPMRRPERRPWRRTASSASFLVSSRAD